MVANPLFPEREPRRTYNHRAPLTHSTQHDVRDRHSRGENDAFSVVCPSKGWENPTRRLLSVASNIPSQNDLPPTGRPGRLDFLKVCQQDTFSWGIMFVEPTSWFPQTILEIWAFSHWGQIDGREIKGRGCLGSGIDTTRWRDQRNAEEVGPCQVGLF